MSLRVMKPAMDEVDKMHDELLQHVEVSKNIMRFLEKRVALEEEYASQVRQLCKSQPCLGPSGSAASFNVLVGLTCEYASSTLSSLANFAIDVINPFKSTIIQLKADIQEAYSEGKRLQQERKKMHECYKRAKFIYEGVAQDQQDDKYATMAESEYRFQISTVNRNQSSYFRDNLPKIIKQFQSSEEILAHQTHDSIHKFCNILTDTSMKCSVSLRSSKEKINNIKSRHDIEKYRAFCDELAQPPPEIVFTPAAVGSKSESELPHFATLHSKFLKTGKQASAKWRSSISILTSPSRKPKKFKRHSTSVIKATHNLFGTPLHQLMDLQKLAYPNLDVPYVAWFLVNHIKRLGGMQTESIFRIPGATCEIQSIKAQLEAGDYSDNLHGCSVYSAAGALTLWLRELPSPLIPYFMYTQCLYAKTSDELVHILKVLPPAHANMLVFLLEFIKELTKPENVARTRMDADSLSTVFTPSILHLQSPSQMEALMNIEKERQFVKSAIDAADILTAAFPVHLSTSDPTTSPSEEKSTTKSEEKTTTVTLGDENGHVCTTSVGEDVDSPKT